MKKNNSLFDENGIWKLEDYMMLDAENMDSAIKYLSSNFPKQDKIGIASDVDGVYEINLDFLKKLPNITHFRLSCRLAKSVDIQPIYNLQQLEWLQWWSDNEIDISRFPKLKTLACFYSDNIKFSHNNLDYLHIVDAPQLAFLDKTPNLKKLELRSYLGEDLSRINHLNNLEDLIIKPAKKLINIEDITKCENLRSLELEGVNKQIDLSVLSKCENIKGLYLHMNIENCLFLKEMKKIESFVCKDILDNDLSPIFESTSLSYVYLYKYKRTYNYSKKEFNERFKQTDN